MNMTGGFLENFRQTPIKRYDGAIYVGWKTFIDRNPEILMSILERMIEITLHEDGKHKGGNA